MQILDLLATRVLDGLFDRAVNGGERLTSRSYYALVFDAINNWGILGHTKDLSIFGRSELSNQVS